MKVFSCSINILIQSYHPFELDERDAAMNYAAMFFPSTVPDILKFKGRSHPFKPFMFTEEVLRTLSALTWWKSVEDDIHQDTKTLVRTLFTAIASSAGIERVFSSFGFVHSDVRNRLGTEKAAKLTFMYKVLNSDSH